MLRGGRGGGHPDPHATGDLGQPFIGVVDEQHRRPLGGRPQLGGRGTEDRGHHRVVTQVGERDRRCAGQGMRPGQHGQSLLVHHHPGGDRVVAQRSAYDRDVRDATSQTGGQFVDPVHLERDIGVSSAPVAQDPGGVRAERGPRVAEPQRPAGASCGVRDVIEGGKGVDGRAVGAGAGAGQGRRAGGPLDQRDAYLRLEGRDHARDGGLRDPEPDRGVGERPLLHQRDEGAEMPQLERCAIHNLRS